MPAMRSVAIALILLACLRCQIAQAAPEKPAIDRWLKEFQPSTLTRQEQRAELEWFINAAKPFRGQTIRVVSETIDTHKYESAVLAKAFTELTGIRVVHDTIPEGELVRQLKQQMLGGKNVYDAYVNDSDLIGTHFRYGKTLVLSDWMQGDGRDVTLPTLDLKDFIGLAFTTSPDGKLYQLPDQQFANLYWFRYDWFSRPELKQRFKQKYGYELGVPLNWSAYEDIAAFFSNDVRELDGQRIYGHMDYGKKDPSLGWRFTDAWLSMAGAASKGYPNGTPIDEWGIRVENCRPVGASVTRGGATNSPAAVYALRKYLDWQTQFAPPGTLQLDFTDAGPIPGKGQVAQQIFWYTSFTAALTKPGLPINNPDGSPKWRVAPSPHGAYWEPGMQRGYQDVGAWTLLSGTPVQRQKMAWLYAQFTVSRTVSLKKSIVGLTFIRDSDIRSPAMTRLAPKLGGLIEFYRSPARVYWTPTGPNVPDYPALAELWWRQIGAATTGEKTPQRAMDDLAQDMDSVLAQLETSGLARCAPKLGNERSKEFWFSTPDGPRRPLPDERPRGKTIDYDKLLRIWREGGDSK
ncbi:ABC transporter substrate-binding protein [Niveibacterium microcysteis]|uniref:Carbohydrate ABC transporter substrate-binding protein n=1 Tax=Niveibacterium microcysteis TaxID=2811415 RepID=A0ABX7M9I6_9RHOO|nr:ABC transporter substrate-binding protein [Niveibacterium microcysteis]QSI78387.1 carbohydrate ABC transporter substrate-binding protein [Niveibacterium microcysteis]